MLMTKRRVFVVDVSLFLGFPIIPSYIKVLEQIDSKILKFFISEDDPHYLKELVFDENRYFGKFVGNISSVSDLELLEKNIYSILNKFIPNISHEDVPLVLFAAQSSSI